MGILRNALNSRRVVVLEQKVLEPLTPAQDTGLEPLPSSMTGTTGTTSTVSTGEPADLPPEETNGDEESLEQEVLDPEFKDVEELDSVIKDDADLISDTLEGVAEPEQGVDDPNPAGEVELAPAQEVKPVTSLSEAIAEMVLAEGVLEKGLAMKIVDKSKGKLKFAGIKRGGYRLSLTNLKDDIAKVIKTSLKGWKVKPIKPGAKGSLSSKYTTYVVMIDRTKIPVVFSAGKNEGQKFEAKLKSSVATKKGPAWRAIMTALGAFYNISEADVAGVVKSAGGNTRVKRPFSDQLLDVGQSISDMTLTLVEPRKIGGRLQSEVYVSIKNVSGATIANTGYSDAFITKKSPEGRLIVEARPSASNPNTDKFLEALGVNKDRIAAGLTAYANKIVYTEEMNATPTYDKDKVKMFLAAQLGYGYVYLREKKDGSLKIINLSSPAKALEFIGEVQTVAISYPYYADNSARGSRKQCTAKVTTDKGVFDVEIRSASGGVANLLQCNIRLVKDLT